MDSPDPAGVVQAAPSRMQALALLGLGVVLVVVGLRADLAGTTLALPGAAAAVGLGLRDLLVVPVLRADATGLTVRVPVRRRRLDWADVVDLGVVKDRGAVLLQVDLVDDEVLLLSRWRLGRDPRDVLQDLQSLRA